MTGRFEVLELELGSSHKHLHDKKALNNYIRNKTRDYKNNFSKPQTKQGQKLSIIT